MSSFPLRSTTGKAPPASESGLQRMLVEYLQICVPSVTAFAIPMSSMRTHSGRASNAVAGLRKGVFDLALVLPPLYGEANGVTAFVEVKTARGKLSAEQHDFARELTEKRVPHCIVRSLDDLKDALRTWRVPTLDAALPKAEAWPSS